MVWELCMGQGRTQVSLLGQGGDGTGVLQAQPCFEDLSPSPDRLLQRSIPHFADFWELKYLPGDKYCLITDHLNACGFWLGHLEAKLWAGGAPWWWNKPISALIKCRGLDLVDWRTLEGIQLCQPWTPLIALTQGVIWRCSVEVSPPEENLSTGKRELDSRPESVYSCGPALPGKKRGSFPGTLHRAEPRLGWRLTFAEPRLLPWGWGVLLPGQGNMLC